MDLKRVELLALLAMAFGVFMDGLDSSIVNIALPTIAEYFGVDANAVAWVVITYFMMIAGLMLSFGRLADSGHIRKIYILGFAIFGASSLVCGLSQDLWTLVGGRVVQGIGAAMLGAVAPMICVKFLPPSKLGLAMSVLMLSGALGFGSGPAIGGIIMDISSWHWTFFINVPIAIIAILFALRAMPKDHDIKEAKLDLLGSAALFLSVICGVYVLEMFSREGQEIICAVMAVMMVVFIIVFIRAERRAKNPTLNLSMFKDWNFDSVSMCYFLMNISYVGISYLVPFYIAKELDVSYTFTGILILIPSIVTICISLPAGRYADNHGRRNMAIVSCLALIMFSIGYWLIRPDMGWLPFIPIGIMGGIMWGLCGASVASRIVDHAAEDDKGMSSTLSNFLYYAGGSIGSALFASFATIGSNSIGIPLDLIPPEDFLEGFTFSMIPAILLGIATLLSAVIVRDDAVKRS